MTSHTPTFAVGDLVRVRNVYGLWRIIGIRLVADEAVVRRGAQTRTVPAVDVLPVRQGGAK